MFDIKDKCWKSGKYTEAEKVFHRERSAKGAPASMFAIADMLLESAERGKQNADAVYLMESAAKGGHPMAAYSLGQMFQYGWAVAKSKKLAILWYEKAAELGSEDAQAILERLRAEKKRNMALVIVSVILAVLLAAAATLFILFGLGDGDKKDKDKEKKPPKAEPVVGVIVGDNTRLDEVDEPLDLRDTIYDIVDKYDDKYYEEYGRTFRIIIFYEGGGIDLSPFPAKEVIDYGDDIVIIQFDNAEDTDACLKALGSMDCVTSFSEDAYSVNRMDYGEVEPSDLYSSGEGYVSPATGYTYCTWGVEYMGVDLMAEWVSSNQKKDIIVGVIDSGSEPWPAHEDRYLDGADFTPYNKSHGQYDDDGHGTHVAGTIIDCTQGLNVYILPAKVLANLSGYTCVDSIVMTAIIYEISEGVDVINMSLGGGCSHSPLGSSCGNAIDMAVEKALAQNIAVVVAAGNGDEYANPMDTADNCPAHIEGVITVGAVDINGDIGSFSNYGDAVDIAAPGVNVLSYYPGGNGAYLDGTSMASPHVAAIAAMIKAQFPDATPAEIEKYIKVYSVDMGNESYFGAGIPWAGYFAGE